MKGNKMKKTKSLMIIAVVMALMLTFGYEMGSARDKSITPARIGVVNIRRVFENNKKNAQWQKQMEQQRDSMVEHMEKMAKDIEAAKADMATRKKGSKDYQNLMQEVMEKRAQLEARKKFYEQDLVQKEKNWNEQMYQQILAKIKDHAQKRGLDMVLAKEELTFPTQDVQDLLLTIRTTKVLYSSDMVDITNDVLAAIDRDK
jgi:Skp family chaperone for outer membrane proteins